MFWCLKMMCLICQSVKLILFGAFTLHSSVMSRFVMHLNYKDFLCLIRHNFSVLNLISIEKFQSIFGNEMPPHKPHGILTLEHNGMPCEEHDGLGLTLLVSIKNPLEDVGIINSKYTWLEMSKHLGQKLLSRISKNMAVQFNVVR